MTIEWLAGNRIRGTTAERPNASLQSPSVGGWVEVGRTTLGSAGDNIDITSLPDKRYYMYLLHRDTSGSTSARMTFNGDDASSNQNYSTRYASDGTEYTAINQDYVSQHTSASQDSFTCGYIANKSSNEKLVQSWIVGNASPPSRYEQFWKWDNTSNAINRIDIFNHLSGDFASGSELVVLGWDPADTHTTNFWEELASVELSSASDDISSGTFTAKKYLWIQGYIKQDESTASNMRMQFNSDTGSNYAERQSTNGGSDTTGVSADHIPTSDGGKFGNFFNAFIINNSSNEKLAIIHGTSVNTEGAGTAPTRREIVGRWANTSSQITSCRIFRTVGGQYQSGTILKVWGSD